MNQLSVEDLQKVTHEMLELIANDTGLQRAYRNNRIPVLEELLQRTAPENQPPPEMRADPPAEPVTSTTDMRATVNFTEDSAHHGAPSADDRPSSSSSAVMQNAARYLREQQGSMDSDSRGRGSSASSTPRSVSPAPSLSPGSTHPSPHLR
ncbi:hypothetical protein [Streptomyces sp. NRRL B-3229]|uniref:hypothetical protein n=1 Tax=Streptomyces sp. NRRL B-3229 TaxID=1463836 RepID=UPI00131EA2D9|nr:hypothetical protein [Streptomyces sp. NRRL B-3229]